MEAALKVEDTADDQALVQRVQTGDVRAFEPLILRYQDRIHNACWRMCGNVEDARDLTQEAFLKALRSINSFQGASGFYTWLFRIAMNLTLTHRKRARLRLVGSLDQPDDSGATVADRIEDRRSPSPSENAMKDEARSAVARALENIDPHHRAVIVLRDMEGFDYQRIAEILDVPVGTIKSRVHRARVALRDAIENAPSVCGEKAKNR